MRHARIYAALLCCSSALGASGALAAEGDCTIEPFVGATLPKGATAKMRVVSNGKACRIINFGVSAERKNPAESGSITVAPSNGKAEFVAPRALYTPNLGFVGEDEFSYEAFAKGTIDQQVHLRVRVLVTVVAP